MFLILLFFDSVYSINLYVALLLILLFCCCAVRCASACLILVVYAPPFIQFNDAFVVIIVILCYSINLLALFLILPFTWFLFLYYFIGMLHHSFISINSTNKLNNRPEPDTYSHGEVKDSATIPKTPDFFIFFLFLLVLLSFFTSIFGLARGPHGPAELPRVWLVQLLYYGHEYFSFFSSFFTSFSSTHAWALMYYSESPRLCGPLRVCVWDVGRIITLSIVSIYKCACAGIYVSVANSGPLATLCGIRHATETGGESSHRRRLVLLRGTARQWYVTGQLFLMMVVMNVIDKRMIRGLH